MVCLNPVVCIPGSDDQHAVFIWILGNAQRRGLFDTIYAVFVCHVVFDGAAFVERSHGPAIVRIIKTVVEQN